MEQLLQLLKYLGIDYSKHNHAAVLTVAEAKEHDIHTGGVHCKNMFLKDKKGKLFLYSCPADKQINMNILPKKIGCKRLSFADPSLMLDILNISPGAVSPFAIMNDSHAVVKVVLDKDIMGQEEINFHPLVNTATITVSSDDLIKFIEHVGNDYMIVEV